MIRIALLGCGNHSRRYHAAPLARYAQQRRGELELVAACDLDPARAAAVCAEYGFARAFSDLDAMLESIAPDGVVAVMPIPAIAPVAEKLLRAGVRCTVEKPLGANRAQIEALAATAAATGTPHQVSVDRRFNPALNQAQAWCSTQGPLRYVRATMLRHGRREPEFLWGTGIHALDALRSLAGDVTAHELRRPGGAEVTGQWYDLGLAFDSGCLGRLEVLTTVGVNEERYELFGDGYQATVSLHHKRGSLLRLWRDDALVLEQHSRADEPPEVTCGAYDEMAAFVAALAGEREFAPTIAAVYPSVELCLALAG